MPRIDACDWVRHPGKPNRLTGQADGPRDELAVSDAAGLTQFGAHLERLPPGSRTSHRHWHETEDEFLYLISGQLVLIEEVETELVAGDAAGWKAGVPVAHCLENRSDSDALFLVVGWRAERGVVHYPDHDVILHHDSAGATFTRGDGSPLDLGG